MAADIPGAVELGEALLMVERCLFYLLGPWLFLSAARVHPSNLVTWLLQYLANERLWIIYLCTAEWRLLTGVEPLVTRNLAFSLMQSHVENQRSWSTDVWRVHMEPRPLRHSLHASEAQTLEGKSGLLSARLLY